MTYSCQNEGPRLLTGATLAGLLTGHLLLKARLCSFFPFQHLSCPSELPFPPPGEPAAQFFKETPEGAARREMGESPPGLSLEVVVTQTQAKARIGKWMG